MRKLYLLLICTSLLFSQKSIDLYYIDWGTRNLFWELELVSDIIKLWEKDKGEKIFLRLIAIKSFSTLFEEARKWGKDDYKLSASSVTIKKDRLKEFDFSSPYFPINKVILCPSSTNISHSSWNKYAYRFAFLKGSTEEYYAKKFQAAYSFELVPCIDTDDKVNSLKNGKADIMISEGFEYAYNKNYRILNYKFPKQEYYGLLFAKQSLLKPILEKYLKIYLNSSSYDKLIEKHYSKEIASAVRRTMFSD